MAPTASLLVLFSALAGCAGQEDSILVDLRTDLVPGVEFTEAETLLTATGSEVASTVSEGAELGQDFLVGARIAQFGGVDGGSFSARVRLRNADGDLVAERNTLLDFRGGTLGVTIVITRDCQGVTCPAVDGDPAQTECLAGRCRPPECSVDNPESCGELPCTVDADCTQTSSCAEWTCSDGICLARATPGACELDEYCSPEVGCRPLSSDCIPGSPCTAGGPCEAGLVDCSTGMALCRVAGPASAGTPCRDATDACDAPETCDGASTACPPDELAPVGTPCAEGYCNGLGTCAPCTVGAACSTGNPCEVGTTECDTAMPVCVSAGPSAAGTSCRPGAGNCDVAEVCDGVATDCPPDGFEASSVLCRPSAGDCDVADKCTGSSADCPPDALADAATECRSASGPCDVAEKCTGASLACPLDELATAGTVCRPSALACDEPELCNGTVASCPGDAPPLTTCRAEYRTLGTFMWVVPVACTQLKVRAWGAGGGRGSGPRQAGAGGFATGTVAVTPGETLTMIVGGAGGTTSSSARGAGGVPGGGRGGSASSQGGGGGGGYTGVFRGAASQANALVIGGAGGGSGGGTAENPGAGGGSVGQDGKGLGGTQTAGGAGVGGLGSPTDGAALQGGQGGSQGSGDGGGGGGAGWFGGGGSGGANSDAGGGGGGAGYVHPSATGVTLETGNRNTPGGASESGRMTAGNAQAAGAVLLDCI